MASRQEGFSLIESLIALLVLSIGLLGLAQLQTGLWKSAGQLYARSEAYLLSASHLERTLAVPSQVSEQRFSAHSFWGYTTFDSTLHAEPRGRLTEISVTTGWQDTSATNVLGLKTSVYRSDKGDARWLLDPG